jgi:hypothetical protein
MESGVPATDLRLDTLAELSRLALSGTELSAGGDPPFGSNRGVTSSLNWKRVVRDMTERLNPQATSRSEPCRKS